MRYAPFWKGGNVKTKKNEIKSAWLVSPSPLIVNVVYTCGGADQHNCFTLRNTMTEGARKKVLELCGIDDD